MRSSSLCLCALLLLTACLDLACAAPLNRADLGRSEKLRVLVDKVLMADNKWVMSDDNVAEIARAGFNVVSPRLGNDDLTEVRRVALMAQKNGIYHLPWMRGSMVAKGARRMVWQDGSEQELASPNSDELWDWMNNTIAAYAQISKEIPSLIGVFLDYENYSANSHGNCYDLSYDKKVFSEFLGEQQLKDPGLIPQDRYQWLVDHKLHDKFAAYQIAQWRTRCQTLRRLVDAINPSFQFCVYPAPGTLFIKEAIYPEWGTKAAPLILADPEIYGRPAGLMPHDAALKANRDLLRKNLAYAKSRHFPMVYLGGLDPVVRGADPEFCGRNAAMSAVETDGYWVFYEGPTYTTTHPDYFSWFHRANLAIAGGTAERFWQAKRITPDPGDAGSFTKLTDRPQVGVFDSHELMRKMIAEEGTFETHELMGVALEYLKHFDVVVLQNYNVAQKTDEPFSKALRAYVEQGGGVLLAHDTAWFMDSPFPEIATRGLPKHNVEAERHVVETDLKVAVAHPSMAGLAVGTQFKT
ncbi:MAG: hypothetical protein WCP21_15985, partial [Armatimonadota bacterium]